MVDLQHSQLKVFRDLAKGQYQTELTLRQGDLSLPAFENLQVQVRRLFS